VQPVVGEHWVEVWSTNLKSPKLIPLGEAAVISRIVGSAVRSNLEYPHYAAVGGQIGSASIAKLQTPK
jgi:hypothetical protein